MQIAFLFVWTKEQYATRISVGGEEVLDAISDILIIVPTMVYDGYES